ncbi:6-hydroxymethylpterin diphosphokinase MptE-like protein [Arsukibacterium sp.]|uniref:motility associated factor glycosyltransferase family protein n=1 Tax=Arsukibacterium sp. TaxID=1977258 RepID=UPI00299F07F1|nr:6-hydroxymethylpterin diphosphokinase MptE-like protein [Arsukibacterium sp.]MDX1677261.1 6-hydroxymethylpterin diphosphokinase MptE-like protein [Arsukibacterium sp.]
MLKFINYQLNSDNAQSELEQKISPVIQHRIPLNFKALKQYNPQLLELIQRHHSEEYSVFCTKSGQLNLVNVNNGRVIYSATPEQEMQQEVEQFTQLAPVVHLNRVTADSCAESLPAAVDVVMMFGFGLGYQLVPLMQSARIKYLVIYEPQLDNLTCSVQSTDWEGIFELAAATGTQISFQFGNSGASIAEDIQELLSIEPALEKIYLYRHLCHPVSDEVFAFLLEKSGDRDELQRKSRQFRGFDAAADFVEEHPQNVLGYPMPTAAYSAKHKALFKKNLAAFSRLYPDVHQLLSEYQPRDWLLTQDLQGNDNLFHIKRRVFFYDNPRGDSEKLIEHYLSEPFKDDVIVGQAASEKFKSFVHFRYIAKLQEMFLALRAEKKPLPEKVDSLIVFGVALGIHVEQLYHVRDISNLYICEPNLDFFFASLYVTDWASVFKIAEQQQKRIYLNIGGDGSEYFSDLMGQFYQVGAYAIANTYLFSCYYTPQLLKAIQNLKRQLKVVLAIGEYYDHARFGIAHTYLSLKNGHRFMRADVGCGTKHPAVDVPVFLIGNGPSLDNSIDYIKQHRDQVIVVSCGTAIRSLYKLGVQPDFHAEVEQNRATYDWITQVNDPAYLKKIKLISVNGVHPDTASLFGQAYLAFKDGEASTQVFRAGLQHHGFDTASLSYAYPTVSNLALNYILRMNFKTVYLFGVDLGYADVNQHHSKHSAYYNQQGKEVYNYKQFHGEGFPVKGNFRPVVFTKPEFDVSKRLIEQVITNANNSVEIYNCSDGAYIDGARALHPANILLPPHQINPRQALSDYLQSAYHQMSLAALADDIFNYYSLELLTSSIEEWRELLPNQGVTSKADAANCIEQQWHFLRRCVSQKNNPIFYLFYGSANYFLSVLTKVLPDESGDAHDLKRFNLVLGLWKDYLADALEDFVSQPIKADNIKVNYLPAASKQ